MKPNKWKVKFTQIDKPTNTFTATYTSKAEFEKWAKLHSDNGFTVEIVASVVVEIPVASWTYPAQPDLKEAPKLFHVKHYSSDEWPSLIGVGQYFHVEADRDEVEDFAELLNRTIHAARLYVDPDVTYTVEGFISTRGDWVPIKSCMTCEHEVDELLKQLRIPPKGLPNPATSFRVVRVTREPGPELGV
ncbi:hypothetical protein HOT49_gp285 [Erwinia phage vB_EamM_Alexandra]|uniref:Uncharacterized protein n=1 Tax=Erwinia phage vB_EamM_Alexandra TaxID=2201424 RepID=A0A2Z4QF44_9CAUD|nr:hypothetical protein HOT49_gp285 [Erwinia phage vB_EamM_Alexandra]AWY08544.1 hypothetical protein Alexandra_288 [Erwinia phage vB_EamM_Alexandra]